jgi:membrane protein DedA with SNARE-associated domain
VSFETLPMWESIVGFVRAHVAWTPVIVFVLGFAESIAFVSLFVPSTALFLIIGGLHSAAGGAFVPVWIAGAVGAAIGDVISYFAGRYFKNDVDRVWPFSSMPQLVPTARSLFDRWGFFSLIGAKFFGGLRPFVPVVAGIVEMPVAIFIVGAIVSSLLWAGVFLSPGYGLKLLPW